MVTSEPSSSAREPEPDNEGLPPGFVPVWTVIKTEDGVVEYDHPAADLLTEGTDNDDRG